MTDKLRIGLVAQLDRASDSESEGRAFESRRGHQYQDTLELVDRANRMLRDAGFERASVSLKSEATYWRWPDRQGVLRVSSHKFSGGLAGLNRVVARLTFRGGYGHRHRVCMSDERFEDMVAMAIGRYLLKSAGVVLSTYDGPKSRPMLRDAVDP